MNSHDKRADGAAGPSPIVRVTDTADARADGQPVPYTLTPQAEALLNGNGTGTRRHPARAWMLTPEAEALLDAQAEAQAQP
jgi:hypothetical protein